MKLNKTSILLATLCALLVPFALSAADKDPGHKEHATETGEHADHTGHDHAKGAEDGEDHKEEAGHDQDGDEHAGHDHGKKVVGPNGGKVFMSVEPHVEFFVTKDRKIQITFLDHDNKVVPAGEQTIRVICGKRSAPTRLTFVKKDKVLVSDKALPGGMNIPTVMQIKTEPTAKSVMERFNLNLNDCPSCDYLEYACTCVHGDAHEGHDH